MAARRRCRSSERAPLPGEVVSRRQRTEKKEAPEDAPVVLDPKAVLAMKPERRLKWLITALDRLRQGKVQSHSIYEILVHPKFPRDARGSIVSKMYSAVCAHVDHFSSKQQRVLETDSKLAQLSKEQEKAERPEPAAAAQAPAERQEREPAKKEAKGAGNRADRASPERQIMDEDRLNEIVERLLRLTPVDAAHFIETLALDSASRERLENCLEARILARSKASRAPPASTTTADRADAPRASSGSGNGSADVSGSRQRKPEARDRRSPECASSRESSRSPRRAPAPKQGRGEEVRRVRHARSPSWSRSRSRSFSRGRGRGGGRGGGRAGGGRSRTGSLSPRRR
eukprot:TRINITY_DN3482_c0_g1_i1.p1 TRINITY_DN3482_c0_g1~~TRINITY_DN3482_c0_g1_i1.p1  ORF type:complete len:377 (-),score=64.80 TRINITY_DN3482_c0_g1_i1:255-1286(-)